MPNNPDPLCTYIKQRYESYKNCIRRELTRENEEEIKKFLKLPSEYVLTDLKILKINQGLSLNKSFSFLFKALYQGL